MAVMPTLTISGQTLVVWLCLGMFLPKHLLLLPQTLLEIVPRSTKALLHPTDVETTPQTAVTGLAAISPPAPAPSPSASRYESQVINT